MTSDPAMDAVAMAEEATPQASAAPRGRRAKALALAVQAALSAVLAYLVAKGLDWRTLGDMAQRLSPSFLLGSSVLMLLVTVVITMRWQQVLASMGLRPGLPPLLRQNFMGIFFNNFAPSMLGQDAAKTYYLGRNVGYVAAGTSVLVDKILGLGSLTVLGAALIPLLGLTGPLFAGALTGALLLSAAAAVALCALRFPLERLLPPFLARWNLGRRLLDLAARSRGHGSSALGLRSLAATLAAVLASTFLTACAYAWFLTEATGAAPGQPQLMCALCLVNTITNLPLSVNGIGVREQAHALLLAALGVPLEAAVGLSLLQYVFLTQQSLIGWVLWLRRNRGRAARSTI